MNPHHHRWQTGQSATRAGSETLITPAWPEMLVKIQPCPLDARGVGLEVAMARKVNREVWAESTHSNVDVPL